MTVTQARKILGKEALRKSDEDIQKVLNQFYGLAEIVANTIIERGSKNKSKGIEIVLLGGHNGR